MTSMTDTTFRARYTVPAVGSENVVKIADFRDEIDHLFRVCNVDFHACVGVEEKARWVEIARKVAINLSGMTCKRATVQDWDRREAALDRSASLIISVRGYELLPSEPSTSDSENVVALKQIGVSLFLVGTGVTKMMTETEWMKAKSNAVRVVTAPGSKFLVETAYQADGSRVERTKCHGDGYVTIVAYKPN